MSSIPSLEAIRDWCNEKFTLKKASSSTLGGIKVGSGLSIAQDGTLSATGGSIEYATSAQIQALFNNDYLNGDSSSVTF